MIAGLGRSPEERNGNPLQYSCLENPMDRGAWQTTVHGVTKSQTRLSDFTIFTRNTREGFTHGHHQMVNTKIRLIIFFAAKDEEALYNQQNQDREQTVAQIMNSLLSNSDLN